MSSFRLDDSNRKNLQQVIQDYRKHRERLIIIQKMTKDEFEHITNILRPVTADLLECVNTNYFDNINSDLGLSNISNPQSDTGGFSNDNLFQNVLDEVKVEIGNPAIAIVGQVKAGKSTFINVLLKKNIVCQSYERCTSRLTRLTYSPKNHLEIIDVHGNVIKKKHLSTSTIPKKYLNLKEKDRNNFLETSKQIRAGIKSEFLEYGIDIIDSPGLNENATLTRLSKDMIKSVLPIMIYVIDGRVSVRQTDISDLLELKNTIPNIQIIYFVTKLDPEDGSENGNAIELANRKMDIAFQKLKYNNFIPESFKNWSECPYFHGASLYSNMDFHKNKRSRETVFHYRQFSKFENALYDMLLSNFQNKIYSICNAMINFQMDVLTKIINRAKVLSDFRKDHLNQVLEIKKVEEELFTNIKTVITSSKSDLVKRLVKRLQDETNVIISPIADMEYPITMEVPDNGMVNDKSLIKQCQSNIMRALCQGLENIVKLFVEEEFFTNYRNTVEKLLTPRMRDILEIQNRKIAEKTSYGLCLEKLILENYKFNSVTMFSDSEGNNTILKFMNAILTSVKFYLLGLFKSDHDKAYIDVKSSSWKLQQAKECLRRCDHHLLAEEVCQGLITDFKNKHNAFLLSFDKEYKFVQKKILFSEEIRSKLAEKAPDFAGLLMLTLDVKCRYFLQNIEENDKIVLGQGGQGKVYKCICNGKELAKKIIQVNVEQLNEIAEEIYYSYSFSHPHLLPMIAISINDTHDNYYKEIAIYSPLMKTDVLKYLKANLTTLKDRLRIGLQVAEALQYLHKQEIMHRDLKLANILLDHNNDVFLADYGYCKSIALTEYSYVGTPLHIAPEVLKKKNYDCKIDIYSFGILLWYLSEGTGKNPKYSKQRRHLITLEIRPERPDNIPDELWDLTELCWDNEPSVRPDIDIIIQQLNDIISK